MNHRAQISSLTTNHLVTPDNVNLADIFKSESAMKASVKYFCFLYTLIV